MMKGKRQSRGEVRQATPVDQNRAVVATPEAATPRRGYYYPKNSR